MEMSKKISTIVRIAALAIIVVFFIPSFCVSCGDIEVEFSAFDAAIGTIDEKTYEAMGVPKDSQDDADSIEAEPLLFIIVILALVIFKFTNKRSLISILSAAGCAGMMLLMSNGINTRSVEELKDFIQYGVKTETIFGYTLHMILCAGIIVILLYERLILDNPERKEQISSTASKICQEAKRVAPEIWQEVKKIDKPPVEDHSQAEEDQQEKIEVKKAIKVKPVPVNKEEIDTEGLPIGNEEIVCPKCGVIQNNKEKVCLFCGQRFE